MGIQTKFEHFKRYGTDWRRLLFRGSVMVCVGLSLVLLTLLKPDVRMFNTDDLSWLPFAAFTVFVVGVLECFDALIAKELRDFFLNIQNGVLDVVVGALIIASIGDGPSKLAGMIAAFLISKGILRTIMTLAMKLPNKTSAYSGALVSFVFGVLAWLGWPVEAAWFLAIALSCDIAFRGWYLIAFAWWFKKQKDPGKDAAPAD